MGKGTNWQPALPRKEDEWMCGSYANLGIAFADSFTGQVVRPPRILGDETGNEWSDKTPNIPLSVSGK